VVGKLMELLVIVGSLAKLGDYRYIDLNYLKYTYAGVCT